MTQAVSQTMAAKAQQLAMIAHTWNRGRSKVDGTGFYVVPASDGTSAHYFNLSFPDPILFSNRTDPRFPYHGTADWPCEIPEGEARHHSLVLIEAPDESDWAPDSAAEQLERGPR